MRPTANAFEAYGEPLAAGDEFFLIAEFFSTTYCTIQYGVFVATIERCTKQIPRLTNASLE